MPKARNDIGRRNTPKDGDPCWAPLGQALASFLRETGPCAWPQLYAWGEQHQRIGFSRTRQLVVWAEGRGLVAWDKHRGAWYATTLASAAQPAAPALLPTKRTAR